MPFCFKRKESVAKAVWRLCCERADEALNCLHCENHLDGVHNVRREIKKLRAILRLLRSGIQKRNRQKIANELRDVASHLATMRDAHVMLNAFDELTKHFNCQLSARPFHEIKKVLGENCRAE